MMRTDWWAQGRLEFLGLTILMMKGAKVQVKQTIIKIMRIQVVLRLWI